MKEKVEIKPPLGYNGDSKKNPHAVALGQIRSPKKAAAARRNGKLGGRPKKQVLV